MEIKKPCDTCDCQEGRHYCLLYGKFIKNMDVYGCEDWVEKKDKQHTDSWT